MAKITVNISNESIDLALKKHVKTLEAQVKRLKESNKQLSNKIRDQKFKVEEARRIVSIASDIASEFGEEWGE